MVAYHIASVHFLVYTFSVCLLYLQSLGFSIRISLDGRNCSKILTACLDCTSPRCFSYHFERGKIMSPCVTHNERAREWKSRTQRKHKQDRNEDRMRQRHRRGAGRDSKRAKALALPWQFLSHGREDVSSHAPVVRLKNVGLLHSIQQSNTTLGCLVGRELVIAPSLHLLAPLLSTSHFTHHKHLHSACFSNPPMFPGHHVTRRQTAPFCSFSKTHVNTNSAANGPGGACIKQSVLILKIKWSSVKQNPVLPQCLGYPAGDRGEAPIFQKANEQW